ncbi:MAG: hypothetical protein AAGJ74_04495 [Pseudomonadota bacterium]
MLEHSRAAAGVAVRVRTPHRQRDLIYGVTGGAAAAIAISVRTRFAPGPIGPDAAALVLPRAGFAALPPPARGAKTPPMQTVPALFIRITGPAL